MNILVFGPGEAGLSVAAKLSRLCSVRWLAISLHCSSMPRDITRGRPTGIDFLKGAIVAKGKIHGIPTPVNTCIVDLVEFRESLNPAEGS